MSELPKPQLSLVYRLEARLDEPLDLGETALGRRRIVPQTAGTFRGPETSGRLLPGASADLHLPHHHPDRDRRTRARLG
jgi:hypothetical protein